MEKESLISIQQFCKHYNIEFSFLDSLEEYGLVEIITIEETRFIPIDKIKDVERIHRMHDELDINFPGIETINRLLQQIEDMQHELTTLRNRLNRHQED